jgi:hypothetical protein
MPRNWMSSASSCSVASSNSVRAGADFSLILCGVHFDDIRVLELLQSIASNRKDRPVPVLCVRAARGVVREDAYGALSLACSELGGRYLDMTHWIDAEGKDSARHMFQVIVATMIRDSGRRHSDISGDEATE